MFCFFFFFTRGMVQFLLDELRGFCKSSFWGSSVLSYALSKKRNSCKFYRALFRIYGTFSFIAEVWPRLWNNMATGLTAKIRLVKRPRCRWLLPELPDIPVYKCGGCDAILIGSWVNAKPMLETTRNLTLVMLVMTGHHDNGKLSYRDSPEQEEYCILSPEATSPSSGECFIHPNDVKGQKERGDVSQEKLAHIKSSECL